MALKLYIGNKNYSSWSLRGWLALRAAGIAFEEVMVPLDFSATSDFRRRIGASLNVRFACLGHDLGKGATPPQEWPRHLAHEARSVALVRQLGTRLRVPVEPVAVAVVVAREHGNVHRSLALAPTATVRLLERMDAFRRPGRFAEALIACECDARGRAGFEDRPYPQRDRLLKALDLARGIDTAGVAEAAISRGAEGPQIADALHRARIAAVAAGMSADKEAGGS